MLMPLKCWALLLTSPHALCTADTSDWKSPWVAVDGLRLVRFVTDDSRLLRLLQKLSSAADCELATSPITIASPRPPATRAMIHPFRLISVCLRPIRRRGEAI